MKNNSTILRSPSFLKGMARVCDLFGHLDDYRYSEDPDAELIQRDWELTGQDLMKEIVNGRKISAC
ncbi:MAG: hypothetical protein ABIJ03_04085 [Patescibacteria group bacterium]|nr:hypothetical protein [Patescibacteria group bacterium]